MRNATHTPAVTTETVSAWRVGSVMVCHAHLKRDQDLPGVRVLVNPTLAKMAASVLSKDLLTSVFARKAFPEQTVNYRQVLLIRAFQTLVKMADSV